MKIKLHISKAKSKVESCQLLAAALNQDTDVVEKLEDADVLIIIGCWNHHSSSLAGDAKNMGIPFVVVPWGDVSRWNLKKPFLKRKIQKHFYQKRIFKNASGVIATTPMEKEYLAKRKWIHNVDLVRNWLYSSFVTEEDTIKGISTVCHQAWDAFEVEKAEKIAKKTKDAICQQLLQIKSRMPHHNIPISYFKKLHTLLYADNYDEDNLNDEIDRLHLTSFAQAVFQVMSMKTGLSEGFMPIPAKKNHIAKKIEKYSK